MHAHCVVPKALELMGRPTSAHQSRGPGISEVGLRRLGEMDAQGIDVEAISINPFWYRAERDLAAEVIKQNLENLRRNHYAPHVMCETTVIRSQGAKPCAPSKATFPSLRWRP